MFRSAFGQLPAAVREVLEKSGLTADKPGTWANLLESDDEFFAFVADTCFAAGDFAPEDSLGAFANLFQLADPAAEGATRRRLALDGVTRNGGFLGVARGEDPTP